jgi:hypothetical protein
MADEPKHAKYTGEYKHVFADAGFAVWLPTEWHRLELASGNQGALFVPDLDDLETSVLVEKTQLEFSVEEDDIPVLREGFKQGLAQMDIIEVVWEKETITRLFKGWDARFVYRDGETVRKRWVRTMFWGDTQLTFIAQGKDVETYDYYQPMFFNTFMTFEMM